MHGLRPTFWQRYFTAVDGGYEIKKLVRRFVIFGQHDLAQRAPFPRIDLALCRNVLIYFTPELQRRALQLFAFSLRTSGRLVLGKSETTSALAEYFVLEEPRLKIYRRQGARLQLVPEPQRERPPLARAGHSCPRWRRPSATRAAPAWPSRRRWRRRARREPGAERLLQDLPVGVVVVDRRYDVQAINTVARRLLAIHLPAIGEDFIHLARRVDSSSCAGPSTRRYRADRRLSSSRSKSLDPAPDGLRHLEITCFPQQTESPSDSVDRVVVIVSELGERAEPPPSPPASPARVELDRLDSSLGGLEEGRWTRPPSRSR